MLDKEIIIIIGNCHSFFNLIYFDFDIYIVFIVVFVLVLICLGLQVYTYEFPLNPIIPNDGDITVVYPSEISSISEEYSIDHSHPA